MKFLLSFSIVVSLFSQNNKLPQENTQLDFKNIISILKKDQLEKIKNLILDKKFDLNAKDTHGYTLLHWASLLSKDTEFIRFLIYSGANIYVKANGRTPFLLNVNPSPNTLENIKVFLKKGVNINEVDSQGNNLLHLAMKHNTPLSFIKNIIELGINVNQKNIHGQTPLHIASKEVKDGFIIKLLISKGAKTSARTKLGRTPLHFVAEFNDNPYLIDILINNKTSINARDGEGMTALHLAANTNPKEAIIDTLVRKLANINALDKNNETPLHKSIFNKNPKIISKLLDLGAKGNIVNKWGNKAIHYYITLKKKKDPLFWKLNDHSY